MPLENDVIPAKLARALGQIADERYRTLVGHVLAAIPSSVWDDETTDFSIHVSDEAPPRAYIGVVPFTFVDLDSDKSHQTWEIVLFKRKLDALSDRDIEYMVARALGAVSSSVPWDDQAYAHPQGQDAINRKRETARQEHAATELALLWGFTPDPGGPFASHGKEQ